MKREYLKKSLIGLILGMAIMPLNLITTYIVFGQEEYLYELEQISSASQLMQRMIITIIGMIFLCCSMIISYESMNYERRAKSTVLREVANLLISMFLYEVSFSIVFLTKDVIYSISYVANVLICVLIELIFETIYNLELKNKINKKIMEKNKMEEK